MNNPNIYNVDGDNLVNNPNIYNVDGDNPVNNPNIYNVDGDNRLLPGLQPLTTDCCQVYNPSQPDVL